MSPPFHDKNLALVGLNAYVGDNDVKKKRNPNGDKKKVDGLLFPPFIQFIVVRESHARISNSIR